MLYSIAPDDEPRQEDDGDRARDAQHEDPPERRHERRAPPLTTAMIALAWCIHHDPSDSESGRVLAKLVLQAAGEGTAAGDGELC